MTASRPKRPLRIGLAASSLHRVAPGGALFRLLAALETAIRDELHVEILALGQTYDALVATRLLADYPALKRLPTRREWFELARIEHGCPANPLLDRGFAFESQTIALIAHDARKAEMLDFIRGNFAFFDRFRRRIATGTTGGLLNELAATLDAASSPWVDRFRSGPMGGDAEIVLEVLEGRCSRVIFFEDPHVARQHEADIQLLERSAWITSERTVCISDRASAERWVGRCSQRERGTP